MFRILAFVAITWAMMNDCHAQDVKVAMYGDSTTYGSTMAKDGSYHQSPANEPASLQWLLRQKFGPVVTVENHGVPGTTCVELLYGLPPFTQNWDAEMVSSTAQIVSVNMGINDAFIPGLKDSDFVFCYQQLAGIANARGKTFVILSPNPILDPHNATLWSLVNDQKYVSQTMGIPMADPWTDIQSSDFPWQDHLPDGIHPDDNLYEIKAQHSEKVIAPIVGWYLYR